MGGRRTAGPTRTTRHGRRPAGPETVLARGIHDPALLAFWVSNGARASELLTSRQRDALPGEQLLGVIRKGTRAFQQLPSSPDAFVWLRLYQEEAWRAGVPRGAHEALWWTLRRPFRSLGYHAARAMLNRFNELLGSNWTLHDLRHTAAYRMARDPELALTDVQWVLGHAHLTTTQSLRDAPRSGRGRGARGAGRRRHCPATRTGTQGHRAGASRRLAFRFSR
ncbi:site-specific integrase [Streptomyces sp. MS1.AVA.3]|uniref:site-specific integrase n=1 Tax=Streptomyces decoyicus TaxID=249567 RepID=UPI0030C41331